MKSLKVRGIILRIKISILVVVWVCLGMVSMAFPQVFPAHEITPATPKWKDSKSCQECHPIIYEEWENSMHHKAGLQGDHVFNTLWGIFGRAMKKNMGKEIYFCALCHTPSAMNLKALVSGMDMPDPNSLPEKEGISCHFCHSITGVKNTPVAPIYTVSVSDTYRGVHRGVEPDEHKVVYSPIHTTATVCSGCHGYLRLNDVSVCNLQTEEWSGKENCLGCHMPISNGPPAEGSYRTTHFSHLFSGSHFQAMLERAASMDLKVRFYDKNYRVTIKIYNQNAHKLPSTQPFRMVVLSVKAFDKNGKVVWQNFAKSPKEDKGALFIKLFGKGDKVGVPTWEADRIALDTRIGPREEVLREYLIPANLKPAKIVANLIYYLVPPNMIKKFGLKADGYVDQPHLLVSKTATVN